jgi:hypothetical protein
MDTTVAQTILAQLGGHRFLAMTGARQLIGSATSLSFTLPGTPGFVTAGINVCRITLTPMDTYTVEYLRVRRGQVHVITTCADVYAEDLQDCFARETGLATRL